MYLLDVLGILQQVFLSETARHSMPSYCLMASWLFCFLCFTSYVSLTSFYTENEPIKLVIRDKLTFILHSIPDPPSLITRAPDQVVLDGGTAINLTCTADGEPEPNITWTKVFANGSDSDVLFTGDQFILPSNRTIDGTYRCKASNGIGSDVNHTVTVVVHCEYCLLYVNDFQSILLCSLLLLYQTEVLHFK